MTTKKSWRQTTACWILGLALIGSPALADAADELPVRHQRSLWWDKPGVLALQPDGLRFTVRGEDGNDHVVLAWNDIQQLTLSTDSLRVVTYRDQRWQLGRDKQFHFTADLSAATGSGQDKRQGFEAWSNTLREKLGDRLVLAIAAQMPTSPRWSIPAKRNGFPSGTEGTLLYDGAVLQFQSSKRGESRHWPLGQIETATLVSARELIVVAPERAMADQGGMRSFSFQLKQPMGAQTFRDLWRSIEAAHGTKLRFQPGQ